MVGMLREKLMEIVLSEGEEIEKKRDEFIELTKKYLVPIKPGRSFPRKKSIV